MTLQELQDLLQLNIGPFGDKDNFNNLKSAILDNKTSVDNAVVTAASGGFENYHEVVLTDTDIKALGGTPFELLPAPGAGFYYEAKVLLEYTYDTAVYDPTTNGIGFISVVINEDFKNINPSFLSGAINRTIAISNDTPSGTDGTSQVSIGAGRTNNNLYITTWNGTEIIGAGLGTIRAKVYYNTKTFGTEL